MLLNFCVPSILVRFWILVFLPDFYNATLEIFEAAKPPKQLGTVSSISNLRISSSCWGYGLHDGSNGWQDGASPSSTFRGQRWKGSYWAQLTGGGVDGETTQYKVDGDGDGDVLGGNPLAVKKTL